MRRIIIIIIVIIIIIIIKIIIIIIMKVKKRLYIALLSTLQCKKGYKNINRKLTYNPTVHIGKFIA